MIENIVGNKTLQVLEKAMDAASLRHSVTSNNLANVDTPGFKASRVLFEDELKKALGEGQVLEGKLTDPRHIPINTSALAGVTPTVAEDKTIVMRNDGNNVDIDAEMARMAKNTLYYNTVAQQLSSWFGSIKLAINEGRR